MQLHTEFIFFELINFYYTLTTHESIPLTNLKKGFNKLLEFVNEVEGNMYHFNFETELDNLLSKHPDCFTTQNNELVITDDLTEIYENLRDNCENLTELDFDLADFVIDHEIAAALNISIPLSETERAFDLNTSIVRLFIKCGEEEFNCQKNPNTITVLKEYFKYLEEDIKEASDSDITKIKLCINYLSNMYLRNTNKNFYANSAWYIILFSYSEKEFRTLLYTQLEALCSIKEKDAINEELEDIDTELIELDDEEMEDIYYRTVLTEETKLNINGLTYFKEDYEMPIYLIHFLIYLNNYLQKFPYTSAREALIIKKYLLLSLPILANIQDYYLENGTIDTLTLPEIPEEWHNPAAFEMFIETVFDCANNIYIEDDLLLKKPHLMADVITKAIFIKCYLTLSGNEPHKKEVIEEVTKPEFYKKAKYKIASNLIDEIIFSESLTIKR